jgi:hypothetical protein
MWQKVLHAVGNGGHTAEHHVTHWEAVALQQVCSVNGRQRDDEWSVGGSVVGKVII